LGLGALMLVAVSAHIFIHSWDAIQTVLHTAYPGERLENGGGSFLFLFNYPLTTFFPVKETELLRNICEEAFLYDFFPLGILVTCYLFFKEKKKDGLIITLIVFFAIFAARLIVPWPEWLSKITLLSKVLINRLVMVVSWINLLLLIRGLALIQVEPSSKKRLWPFAVGSVVFSLAVMIMASFVQKDYPSSLIWVFTFSLLTLGTLSIVFYHRPYGKGVMLAVIFIICFFSGMTVNPVNRGLETVKDQTLYQRIKQVNEKKDIWIVDSVDGIGGRLDNYPMMAGAATINTTNTYPNMDRWRGITSDPAHEEIFNRYAHIAIEINRDVDFYVVLPNPDSIIIKMNPSYLKRLKVTKILSGRDLTAMSTPSVAIKKITEDSGYYIYDVTYQQ
ncbi:MAG: hypothetical protein IJH61_00720, partial [Eubacteriaceae bacterium]|nr:hypothetical protein [Eubacteriaceae bacterium]